MGALAGVHPDDITFLVAVGAERLTKLVTPNGVDGYDNAKYFDHLYERCETLSDIADALNIFRNNPTIAVVRGRVRDGIGTPHVRRWASEPRTLEDVQRRWLMINIDKPVCEVPNDWKENPEPFVRKVIGLALPDEFSEAGVVLQWSASAGLQENSAKMHLWFRLSQAVDTVKVRQWLRPWQMYMDFAVLQIGQLHFTATPIFEGVDDPIAKRIVLIDGPEVVVPDISNLDIEVDQVLGASKYVGKSYEDHKAAIGEVDFHTSMLRAVGSFVTSNWPSPDLEWLRADLQHHIMTCEAPARTHDERVHRAGRHLDAMIEWVVATHKGRLEQQDRVFQDFADKLQRESRSQPMASDLLNDFFGGR